jgi:hypothetical protein
MRKCLIHPGAAVSAGNAVKQFGSYHALVLDDTQLGVAPQLTRPATIDRSDIQQSGLYNAACAMRHAPCVMRASDWLGGVMRKPKSYRTSCLAELGAYLNLPV